MTITGDDAGDFLEALDSDRLDSNARMNDLSVGALPPPLRWRINRNGDGSFTVAIHNPSTGQSLSLGRV